MATAQEKSSTDVFRNILAHLAEKYPAYDFGTSLTQLVIEGVINHQEMCRVKGERTPLDRGMCLFMQILPPKPLEMVDKCFDILRRSFEKDVSFLNGQLKILHDTGRILSSTDVLHAVWNNLTTKYPTYDFERLLAELVRQDVISLNESALVRSKTIPVERGLCLFLNILPTKSMEKIKKSFQVLRCNFENEIGYLNEQQKMLER